MTQYTAWLFFIVMLGVVIGMVGVWRIGANYVNDYSARYGAVTTDSANEVRSQQAGLFEGLTGGDITGDDNHNTVYEPALGSRTSLSGIYNDTDLAEDSYAGAQSRVRLERFYPGKEICDSYGNCRE